jgi:hypothetical protein
LQGAAAVEGGGGGGGSGGGCMAGAAAAAGQAGAASLRTRQIFDEQRTRWIKALGARTRALLVVRWCTLTL